MLCSVICACKDEEADITSLLCSLANQTFPNFEAIFVDDSSDQTPELIKNFGDPRFSVIDGTGTGCCDARNLAIFKVTGDFIVFVTADTVLPEDHLERISTFFVNDIADVVICDAYSVNDRSATVKFYNLQHVLDRGVRDLTSQGYAVDREQAQAVGGIASEAWVGINFCRDWSLVDRMLKAGARHIVDNASVVGHKSPSTLREFFYDRRLRGRMSTADSFVRKKIGLMPLAIRLLCKTVYILLIKQVLNTHKSWSMLHLRLNREFKLSFFQIHGFLVLQDIGFLLGEYNALIKLYFRK